MAVVSLIRCSTPRPSYYQHDEAHPNPYSPFTKISYVVDDSCHVMIVLYNVQGQVVDTLMNAVQGPGTYWKTVDSLGKHEGGLYFYKVSCGEKTSTKKVLLLK